MSTNSSKFFTTERAGTTLIVTPVRGLGSLAGPEFTLDRTALVQEISASNVQSLLIDFEKVEYFGSLLLDSLCVAWKHAREKGAMMSLCNLSPIGREIIAKAKLNALWPSYGSREEAIEAMGICPTDKIAPSREVPMTRTAPSVEEPSRMKVLETDPVTVVGFGGYDLPPEHVLGRYLGDLYRLIDSTGCRQLAFDMSGITMVPSGFLGVLASIVKRGIAVSVRNPSKDVREVLELTHFDRIITIEP